MDQSCVFLACLNRKLSSFHGNQCHIICQTGWGKRCEESSSRHNTSVITAPVIYIYIYMHVRSANPDPVERQQNMKHVKIT
jgi:hypothetical protein